MKYILEFCSRCNNESWHRIFRRYGKSDSGKGKGKKGLRRTVIWCLNCQKRRIQKPEKRKRRYIILRE